MEIRTNKLSTTAQAPSQPYKTVNNEKCPHSRKYANPRSLKVVLANNHDSRIYFFLLFSSLSVSLHFFGLIKSQKKNERLREKQKRKEKKHSNSCFQTKKILSTSPKIPSDTLLLSSTTTPTSSFKNNIINDQEPR